MSDELKKEHMENSISMNTLVQAIYSVEFNLKRHKDLLQSDKAASFTDDQLSDYGDSVLFLMQASGELGVIYDEKRRESFPDQPSYEELCHRFVFI